MELIKWPFLKQDWGLNSKARKELTYTQRMEEKYSMPLEAQLSVTLDMEEKKLLRLLQEQ